MEATTTAVANVNKLAVEEIVGSKGAVIGRRTFICSMSAKELNAHFKREGFKGNALRAKVYEAMTNESASALVLATAKLQAMVTKGGYVPTVTEERANTGCIRFVKPKAPKAAKAKLTAEDALAALGITKEDLEAIRALRG